MATAGIVIEAWKSTIFTKHLTRAGLTHTEHPGIVANTLTLKVETDDLVALRGVCEAALKECQLKTAPKGGSSIH